MVSSTMTTGGRSALTRSTALTGSCSRRSSRRSAEHDACGEHLGESPLAIAGFDVDGADSVAEDFYDETEASPVEGSCADAVVGGDSRDHDPLHAAVSQLALECGGRLV